MSTDRDRAGRIGRFTHHDHAGDTHTDTAQGMPRLRSKGHTVTCMGYHVETGG